MTRKQAKAAASASSRSRATKGSGRTSVKLEETGWSGGFLTAQEVSKETRADIVAILVKRGAEPQTAAQMAGHMCFDARLYVENYILYNGTRKSAQECDSERDPAVRGSVRECAAQARALRAAFQTMPERGRVFASMVLRERGSDYQFASLLSTVAEACLEIEALETELEASKHRPSNMPVQSLLRACIRYWRVAIGKMPPGPDNRAKDEASGGVFLDLMKRLVSEAAEGQPELKHMVQQIAKGSYRTALDYVRRESSELTRAS